MRTNEETEALIEAASMAEVPLRAERDALAVSLASAEAEARSLAAEATRVAVECDRSAAMLLGEVGRGVALRQSAEAKEARAQVLGVESERMRGLAAWAARIVTATASPAEHGARVLAEAMRDAALQAVGAAWAIAAPDRQVDSSALVEVVDRIIADRTNREPKGTR